MERVIHDRTWWMPYIEEYQNGNQPLIDYCKERGLSYSAMYWQIRQLRNSKGPEKSDEEVEILPVTIVDEPHQSDLLSVSINGINVTGQTDSIRKILGVKI